MSEEPEPLDIPEDGYPALFMHCKTVYDALVDNSVPYKENEEYLHYVGFITHLFTEMGISIPYYSKVMGVLQEMRCVHQLSRGGGTAESQWLIIKEPTFEAYKDAAEKMELGRGLKQSKQAMLQSQMNDMNNRLRAVENQLAHMAMQQGVELPVVVPPEPEPEPREEMEDLNG